MNYELAKRLKDAGFPQVTKGGEWLYKEGEGPVTPNTDFSAAVYSPTLTELIEACGEGELYIARVITSIKNHEIQGYHWIASTDTNMDGCIIDEVDGETPEEAVALLLLKLNQSKTPS